MTQPIYLRRDTTANWATVNPVLLPGEPGVELMGPGIAPKLKIGNGVLAWNALGYTSTSGTGSNGLSAYELAVANGYGGTLTQWLGSLVGAQGAPGTGVNIKGSLANTGLLPASGNTAGDAYLISGHLWVYSGSAFVDAGVIQGPTGNTGTAATVAVGTVTTGAPGSSATVTNAGTVNAAVLNFAIPKGDTGLKGDKGDPGSAGSGGDPTFDGTFSADPTGVSACDTAWANAMASAKRLRLRAGTYRFANEIPYNADVELIGDGINNVFLYSYTTTGHGMVVTGASALGLSNRLRMSGFTLEYKGAGSTGKHGIVAKRKVFADNVCVKGFTTDGLYFDSIDGTIGGSVFFSSWRNCRFTQNGRDGASIRFGANANIFENCQFDKNKRYGCHHYTDGGATYGNTIIGGQASYNTQQGFYFESGTNLTTSGLYAEYNGSPTNSNSDGYTNTPVDFYVGDNVSRSSIGIGTVLNSDATHVRAPSANFTTTVFSGNQRFNAMGAAVPNTTATTVAGVVAAHNALLVELRARKFIS